ADGDAVFRHEGDFWTVAYAGKAVRLRHGKGLGDIAILLANPGKEVHVADLIAASASAPPDPRSAPAAELVAQGLRASRGVSGDAVLDRRALADYRERLADLHRELEDAERCNDEGRVARARAELDFIAGELASAFGLGGRSRRADSPIERARKAVAHSLQPRAHRARASPAGPPPPPVHPDGHGLHLRGARRARALEGVTPVPAARGTPSRDTPAPLADCYTVSSASRSGAASRTGEPSKGGSLMRARLTAIAIAAL